MQYLHCMMDYQTVVAAINRFQLMKFVSNLKDQVFKHIIQNLKFSRDSPVILVFCAQGPVPLALIAASEISYWV